MELHLLDIIIWIILTILLWIILPEDYKEEMGTLVGMLYIVGFTIIYTIVFYWFLDWIDILRGVKHFITDIKLNL